MGELQALRCSRVRLLVTRHYNYQILDKFSPLELNEDLLKMLFFRLYFLTLITCRNSNYIYLN